MLLASFSLLRFQLVMGAGDGSLGSARVTARRSVGRNRVERSPSGCLSECEKPCKNEFTPKDFKTMLHVVQSRGAGLGREGAAKGLGLARATAPSFAEV